MKLHELKPAEGSKRARRRVGRGLSLIHISEPTRH